MINFTEHTLDRFRLAEQMIKSRELFLGVPKSPLPMQQVHIERAIDYAQLNGIKVEVFHVF
ncbi:MAG TPA: hypothetical protein DIC42_00090 [Holosporales bacterium]|nr:hypothetical protein [Holosporales bacterium]